MPIRGRPPALENLARTGQSRPTEDRRRFLPTYGITVGATASVSAAAGIVLPNHVQMVTFERVFTGSDSAVDLRHISELHQRVQEGLSKPTQEQARLIELLLECDSARAQSLSLVMAVGVLVAVLVQPVAGALSDRTRSRWGRRAPWLALGAALGAVTLTGLHMSTSIAAIIFLWATTLAAVSVVSAPLAATVADRVEASGIGKASLITGVANVLGGIGGTVTAGALFAYLELDVYLIAPRAPPIPVCPLAAILVAGVTLFVTANRPRATDNAQVHDREVPRSSTSLGHRLRDSDFRFAWVSKLLLMLATAVPSTFGMYMLQSYVQPAMSATEATRLVSGLALIALPMMLVSMAVASRWSDRIGRRKPFVFAASLMLGVLSLVPVVSPTLPAFIASSLLTTAAVGVFLVMDQALFIDLLGGSDSAGRDLGLANFGGGIGQSLGPVLAGHMVGAGSGYGPLWIVSAVVAVISALTILPVKRIR